MTVRPAKTNDMEQLCSLYRQMNFEIAALQRLDSFSIEPDKERLKNQISSDNCVILIAESESQLINGFVYLERQDFVTDSNELVPIASIKAYYARRNDQRNTTIHALLNEADKWARYHGAQQITITLLAQDGFAHGMFEKQGFETAARVMCRRCVQ